MEHLIKIAAFILNSFIHIWPYLLVTIPIAVIVNLSGASKYITKAFNKNPLFSVLLATTIGAFSPFCSCGVIPVISSLLIGGVPLAPVMSFWIASPSMDPEIFFLSISVLGWELAVWRLASTFLISLTAGYITHYIMVKGLIGTDVLKTQSSGSIRRSLMHAGKLIFARKQKHVEIIAIDQHKNICCTITTVTLESAEYNPDSVQQTEPKCNCTIDAPAVLWKKVLTETYKATIMVTKFMGISFLITALITFYLPQDIISWIVKGNYLTQVTLATLIGIPMYTSNLTALPMAGGLITLGMNKGAALSFLIAGATTTLPAMVAVWGITKRKIFFLFLLFVLLGAFMAGMSYNLFLP